MKIRTSIAVAAGTIVASAGLFAIPALASNSSPAVVHTLHFTAIQTAFHSFGTTTAVAIDKDVNSHGKVIAWDARDGSGLRDTVALGLKGGFLYGVFVVNAHTGAFAGKVTGGTGLYKGDKGTISGQATSATHATVTVTYHH